MKTSPFKRKISDPEVNFAFALLFILMLSFTLLAQESSGDFDYTKSINATELYIEVDNSNGIPKDLFKLGKLEELTIAGEEVTVLPVEVKGMYSLRVLNLSNTSLDVLPEELSQLRNLQEIHLNYERWQYRLDGVKRITRAKIVLE